MNRTKFIGAIILFALIVSTAPTSWAQEYAAPPRGYNARRPNVTYGDVKEFKYYSSVAERERTALVITPPGYDGARKLPVLYLLHGLGGNEGEWMASTPNEILYNLIADGKAREMILVLPNVRVRHKSVVQEPGFYSVEHFREFDAFAEELAKCLRPAIEEKYAVLTERDKQAIAGLSMGGRESLAIAVKDPSRFGYVGAFEPAPGLLPYDAEPGLFTKETLQLAEPYKDATYLLITKGSRDAVVGDWPEQYADAFRNSRTEPNFTVFDGGHEPRVWAASLYFFLQRLFGADENDSSAAPARNDGANDSNLLFAATRENFLTDAKANPEYGKITVVDGENGEPIARCLVENQPGNAWDFGLRFNLRRPAQIGEQFTLTFKARALAAQTESGLAVVRPYFEDSSAPFTKALFERVEVGREFRDYSFSFRSRTAGPAAFGIFLGDQKQEVEIGAIELRKSSGAFPNARPRRRSAVYRSDPNAAWLKDAEARIEQYRKGDLSVSVVDGSGDPVADVEVDLRETRGAFKWGTCVVARRLVDNSPDAEKYREFVKKYCEVVVFENDLKWFGFRNPRARETVFHALDWLDGQGIETRGHCLVWPSWRNSDPEWRKLSDDPDALRQAIEKRITDATSALSGRLVDWDVLNEPYDNTDIWRILGKDSFADWFKLARVGDATARLFINDYGILSAEGLDRKKQDFYYSTIKELQASNAPVGGIGMQAHFGAIPTPPERIIEIIERFSELGLPIAITEHDVDSVDEQSQAEFTRDFMTAAFSCPAVEKFLIWGFWARSHWRPNAAYFREDWTPTPAGEVWMELVGEKWRTNTSKRTDASGLVEERVFLGDYEITVKRGDEIVKTATTTVDPNGARVEIRLD